MTNREKRERIREAVEMCERSAEINGEQKLARRLRRTFDFQDRQALSKRGEHFVWGCTMVAQNAAALKTEAYASGFKGSLVRVVMACVA